MTHDFLSESQTKHQEIMILDPTSQKFSLLTISEHQPRYL